MERTPINYQKLADALERTGGDRAKAAKILGCTVDALKQRIRKGRIDHGLAFPAPAQPTNRDNTAAKLAPGGHATTHRGESVIVVEMLEGVRCLVQHEDGRLESVSRYRLVPEPSPEEIEAAKIRLRRLAEERRSTERQTYEKGEPGIRVVGVRTMGEAAASMVD